MSVVRWVGQPIVPAVVPPPPRQQNTEIDRKLTLTEWVSILGLTLSAISLAITIRSMKK